MRVSDGININWRGGGKYSPPPPPPDTSEHAIDDYYSCRGGWKWGRLVTLDSFCTGLNFYFRPPYGSSIVPTTFNLRIQKYDSTLPYLGWENLVGASPDFAVALSANGTGSGLTVTLDRPLGLHTDSLVWLVRTTDDTTLQSHFGNGHTADGDYLVSLDATVLAVDGVTVCPMDVWVHLTNKTSWQASNLGFVRVLGYGTLVEKYTRSGWPVHKVSWDASHYCPAIFPHTTSVITATPSHRQGPPR